MKPLWDRLGELAMPVTVLVGDRDAKFRALGQRMVESLPLAELVIAPGGHGLPLENPAAVAGALD
jgi:pimeloyl-ACP methyl ester carboxylesterase